MARKLSDEVVILRPWAAEDAPALVECLNGEPEVSRWLDRIPQPYTIEHALGYIGADGEEKFAVTEARNGRILGSIGLTWSDERDVVEVGYWVRADARARGITTRALQLIAPYAFDGGAKRVQLRADPHNAASCRVAEKAGFAREGVLRSIHWNPRLGRRQDFAMYSLLPDELA